MAFTFDGPTRTITEQPVAGNPELVEYNVLRDVYREALDWWHADENSRWAFPFRIEGGSFRFLDDLGNPTYATLDLYLQNQVGMNWRFIPNDYQHEIRWSGANVYRQDRTLPLWDFSGTASNILVEATFSDINTGYQVSATGGLTPAQIADISSTIAGLVPKEVWEYVERTITDVPPNAATATAVANVNALLNEISAKVDAGDITLNATELGRIATAVWGTSGIDRRSMLTDAQIQVIVTEVWSAASRELTGQAAGTLTAVQVAEIAGAVWSATTRELTGQDQGTLTDAQVSAIATAVWGVSDRGMNLDEIYILLGLDSAKPVTAHKDGDTGYTDVEGIRLNRTQTIGARGEITVTSTRQNP